MKKVKLLFFTYKNVLKDLSLYLAANLVQVTIGILMNPILASHLAPSDFAIIGYYESFNLFILPLMGFSFASYYARHYFRWTEDERKDALNSLLLFQALAGMGSNLLLLGLLRIYFIYKAVSFPFFPFAFLSFGIIFVQNFYSLYLLNLRLNKKSVAYFKTSVIFNFVNLLIALIFVVYLQYGALGRLGGLLLGGFLAGCFGLFRSVKTLSINFKLIRHALQFCWPLMLSALLTYFFTGFEKLLLERVHDIHNFSLYSIASKLVSFFIIFSMSIDVTFEPDIYKAIALKDKKRLVKSAITLILIKIIPVAVFLVSANLVVGILTNFRYVEAAGFARILALSSITQSISFTLTLLVVGLGFPKLALVEKAIGAVLVVILNFIMIGHFGFIGAAWAQVFSYLILASISFCIIVYIFRVRKVFSDDSIKF